MIAGYASSEITPPPGLEMCGYGYYLGRIAKGVHDPLFVRGLYMEEADSKFLLISCDFEGMSVETCDETKCLIKSVLGLEPEQVMIHCTHTHSGPALARTRGCGKMDPEYVSTIPGILCSLAEKTITSASDVESIGSGNEQAQALAFNRVYGETGPMDETVRVVVFHMHKGDPIVLVNYACHPVCCGVNDQISADYPGIVVKTLAERGYKPIFVTGFCGDIDPPRDRGYELVEKTGKAVAEAALTAINNSRPVEITGIKSKISIATARRVSSTPEELMNDVKTAKNTLEENPSDGHALCYLSWAVDSLSVGICRDIKAPVQAVILGDIALIGFPGETFTKFGLILRKEFQDLTLLTVNEANGVIGYIPPADEFDNNGYSVIESCRIYGEYTFARGFAEDICDEASALLNCMTWPGAQD
jgi:hypothetical protein